MIEVREMWLLVGMFIVTFGTRYVLFAFAGRLRFSPWLNTALGFVPPVVLAAIVAPAVLMPDGDIWLSWENSYLVAALLALGVALWRNNLLLTIVVGMSALALLRLLLA